MKTGRKKRRANFIELDTGVQDLIGDLGSGGESGNVLSDGRERKRELLRGESGELSLGSVTEDDDRGVRVDKESSLGGLGDGRVDTSAKTRVGRDGNEKDLASLRDGLRVGEKLCRRGRVLSVGVIGRNSGKEGVNEPLLAAPYFWAVPIARVALVNRVEAMTFMDCCSHTDRIRVRTP